MDERNYAPDTLPGGSYPEPPYVPGWDFCGVLDEAPDGSSVRIGEQVIGLALSPMGKVGSYALARALVAEILEAHI